MMLGRCSEQQGGLCHSFSSDADRRGELHQSILSFRRSLSSLHYASS